MNIISSVIPHDEQRYAGTVGDYVYGAGCSIQFRISNTGRGDFNFLILLHELVEAYLCSRNHVDFEAVDKFDMAFTGEGEPGDHPDCPYRKEHHAATTVERVAAAVIGADWDAYEVALERLDIPASDNGTIYE